MVYIKSLGGKKSKFKKKTQPHKSKLTFCLKNAVKQETHGANRVCVNSYLCCETTCRNW